MRWTNPSRSRCIAACELGSDRVGLRVVHLHSYVQRLFVVKNTNFRRIEGGGTRTRITLRESGAWSCCSPGGVVELAVDGDGAGSSRGCRYASGSAVCSGCRVLRFERDRCDGEKKYERFAHTVGYMGCGLAACSVSLTNRQPVSFNPTLLLDYQQRIGLRSSVQNAYSSLAIRGRYPHESRSPRPSIRRSEPQARPVCATSHDAASAFFFKSALVGSSMRRATRSSTRRQAHRYGYAI